MKQGMLTILIAVIAVAAGGQYIEFETITYDFSQSSLIKVTNIVITGEEYVGADEDAWPSALLASESAAEANVTTNLSSGLMNPTGSGERWVSTATALLTKTTGHTINGVQSTWAQRDPVYSVDLTDYESEEGWIGAVFLWPFGKGSVGYGINNPLEYIATNKPHLYMRLLPIDSESEFTLDGEPWWENSIISPSKPSSKAGFVSRSLPSVVVVKQIEELPPYCLVPDAGLMGGASGRGGAPGQVNAVTGNRNLEGLDASVPTPGLPLVASRSYHSGSESGWTHNYDHSISNQTTVFQGETNTWLVLRSGPASLHFMEIGTNLYQSPIGTSYGAEVQTNGETLITLDAGASMTFRTNGLVREIRDGFDNCISISYTNLAGSELVRRAEHSNGLGLDYEYTNGRLARIVTPDTNVYVSYEYDANGRLQSVSRVEPDSTNTEYFAYTSTVDGSGYGLISYTNAIGVVSEYEYATNAIGQTTSRGSSGYVGTNRYNEVTVSYSTNDLPVTEVTVKRDGQDFLYQYEYHPVFHRLTRILGPNAEGMVPANETSFEYDTSGNRTKVVVADWEAYQWMETAMAYDNENRLTNVAHGLNTHAPTNSWAYTWDPDFNTIASITDPEDRRIEFDYTNGLISATRLIVDSNTAYRTDYGYTTNGLLAGVTNANGNAVEYTYDAYGYPDLITPDAGPEIDLDYNVLGHLETITLPWSGMSGPTEREIELDPDGLGRVRSITYPNSLTETFAYDGVGNLLTNMDTAGRSTRYAYEPLGRLRSVTRELVGVSSNQDVEIAFAYDQQFNTLSITDPLGRQVESYALDELDRATAITNVDEQVMTLDYGVGDYVNFITRFDQSDVQFDYDNNGRLRQVFYSDETNTYAYYRNDLLRTAENSVSGVSNTYNSVNRLTQTVVSATELPLSWTNAYAYAPAGQVTGRTSVVGSTLYDYDAAERLETLSDSEGGEFEYGYNPYNGLVSSVEYPNGITCSYSYDIMDRLTGIRYATSSEEVLTLDYDYDNATGMITGRTLTAGSGTLKTAFEYDSLDRLTSEVVCDSTGTELDSASYSYDLAGNRTNKTRNGISVDYELGDGNRLSSWNVPGASTSALISVSGSSSETIGLDPRFGERLINGMEAEASGTEFWHSSVPVTAGSVDLVASMGDEAGNLGYATNSITVTIITNAAYGYDNAGNLTSVSYNSGSRTLGLSWNQLYQLTSVSTNSVVAESYTYDAHGRLLTTTVGSDTIVHVYDGIHCIADTDTNGIPVRSYTYGPGVDNILAMTTYSATETNTYYYLTDHLGSVLAITDDSGAVVETYQYDAYGRTTVYDADGTPMDESALGNRFAFHGREVCWTTGLLYFRARWYDAVTGRWLSKDPIGISGGLNQYVAFRDCPVMYRDPFGLVPDGDGLNDPVPMWGPSGPPDTNPAGALLHDAGNLAGKIWAAPASAVGVAGGLLSVPFGMPSVSLGNNALQIETGFPSRRAVTLGNVVLYGRGASPGGSAPTYQSAHNWYQWDECGQKGPEPSVDYVNVGVHEMGHTYQYQILGPLYPIPYLLSGGYRSILWSGPSPFENAADLYAAGLGSWWP